MRVVGWLKMEKGLTHRAYMTPEALGRNRTRGPVDASILRQAQDEEGGEIPKPSTFLMLSSSKHEEEVP